MAELVLLGSVEVPSTSTSSVVVLSRGNMTELSSVTATGSAFVCCERIDGDLRLASRSEASDQAVQPEWERPGPRGRRDRSIAAGGKIAHWIDSWSVDAAFP